MGYVLMIIVIAGLLTLAYLIVIKRD